MLDRCRLHYLALGGWLVIATALTSTTSVGQESDGIGQQTDPAPQTDQDQPITEPTATSVNSNDDTAQPDSSNRDPEYYNRKNLVAQQRMAVATEGLVAVTKYQLVATAIEIGLIFIAIGIAFWAAIEARRAAKAAMATADISRDTAGRQLRAYVSLKPGKVLVKGGNFRIEIIQENHGQTPAKNVEFSCRFSVLPFPLPDDAQFAPTNFGPERKVIAPGQAFSVWRPYNGIGEKSIAEWKETEERLFVMAVLKYEDIFGDDQETTACWSYHSEHFARVVKYFWSDKQMYNDPVEIMYNSRYNAAT